MEAEFAAAENVLGRINYQSLALPLWPNAMVSGWRAACGHSTTSNYGGICSAPRGWPRGRHALRWPEHTEVPSLDPNRGIDFRVFNVEPIPVGFEQVSGAEQKADERGQAQQSAQAELDKASFHKAIRPRQSGRARRATLGW